MDLLLLEGGPPPDSGTLEGSGAVSGLEPDLEPWGVSSPLLLESGKSPCGASRTTYSRLGTCWDNTSVSSVGRGEEAVGSEFTSDESSEPLNDASSRSLGGLHKHIRREGKLAINEYYELLWYPDTYDLARGLALGGHSSPPLSASVE